MTLAVNIPSHASLCGYNAIASSILCQTKEKREAYLKKLSITQEDVKSYTSKYEFEQLSDQDKNIIKLLEVSDDFDNKLKELFDKSPLEYVGKKISFALDSGTYELNIENYCTSTSVKLLGALIRFKLEEDSAFKSSVLACGEEDLSNFYFKEESDDPNPINWSEKYDNINTDDLILLFSFFHGLNDHEKEKIFIRNPTLEIIKSHEKTDLANEGGFAVIFDAPALPAQVGGDDGDWQVLNRHTGHYNILFSTEIYNARLAEVARAEVEAGAGARPEVEAGAGARPEVEVEAGARPEVEARAEARPEVEAGAGARPEARAGARPEAGEDENKPEYLYENLKNLSESVLKLILELCNTPRTTDANLEEVDKNFKKVISNIFSPSASPKNHQKKSTKSSIGVEK
jgi:hypothetical protein